MSYAIRRTVNHSFDEAVSRVKEELKNQGFGVLTSIDVKRTLQEKLGVDRAEYVIFGACNPNYAHRALELESDLGLLLPCNVVVYAEGDHTVVAAMDPEAVLGLVDNDELSEVASHVKDLLQEAVDRV